MSFFVAVLVVAALAVGAFLYFRNSKKSRAAEADVKAAASDLRSKV